VAITQPASVPLVGSLFQSLIVLLDQLIIQILDVGHALIFEVME
jgi:hypothetical protein